MLTKAIGAAAALLLCMTASAATRVDTQAFSMTYAGGTAAGEIHLLSAAPDAYRIALDSIGNDISGWSASGAMEAYDADGQHVVNGANTHGAFAFDVAAGYRVTGLTFSGIANGGYEAAWHEGRTGIAGNYVNLVWWTGDGNVLADILYRDLAGATMLSETAAIALLSDFTLHFDGNSMAQAQGLVYELGDGTRVGVPSAASIGLHDMVLTVYVSPVPEPATYGMLLGGLALLVCAARRRL